MPIVTFKFKLKFLSPAFIGSAHPVRASEFRLQSLKGVMRYWWRMTQNWTNPNRLFEKERSLFGYTERASPFSMRIDERSNLQFEANRNAYLPDEPHSGRAYLFFSCRKQGRNQPGRKKWIKPGSFLTFSIRFFTGDEATIEEVIFSLWLAQTFGGLGARSRRAAGSFQITIDQIPAKLSDMSELFLLTASNLKEQVLSNNPTEWYMRLIHRDSPLAMAFNSSDHFKETGTHASADKLLDIIGNTMRNYRAVFGGGGAVFRSDARNLYSYAVSDRRTTYSGSDPLPKHAFGLPIIYNFRRRRGRGLEPYYIEAVPDGYERRASPLFISVKQNHNKEYYANLLLLWQEFLPVRTRIHLNVKRRGSSGPPVKSHTVQPPANEDPIVTFIRSVP